MRINSTQPKYHIYHESTYMYLQIYLFGLVIEHSQLPCKISGSESNLGSTISSRASPLPLYVARALHKSHKHSSITVQTHKKGYPGGSEVETYRVPYSINKSWGHYIMS